ncbi:MAG: diaminopimelate epimerase [Planctomycetota bacterium]|nr:diaminopimelate epimerase [Planctomycetota bacterium]
MRFTKMHGLGNDYVFIDAVASPDVLQGVDLRRLAQRMSDRHRGVGADGIIVLLPATDPARADVRMRILNSDGSEGGICGNGTRCAAKLVVERGYVAPRDPDRVLIDAGARLLDVEVHRDASGLVSSATVDMGPPVFELDRVPVDRAHVRPLTLHMSGAAAEYQIDHRTAAFVSMGNPHMVCFLSEPAARVKLEEEGPRFENHPAFPQRINVHFVTVRSPEEIELRTWERGAGATLACASGACAVAAAGVALGKLGRRLRVRMPGGELLVRVDEPTGHVLMTGEAVEIFSGEWRP